MRNRSKYKYVYILGAILTRQKYIKRGLMDKVYILTKRKGRIKQR